MRSHVYNALLAAVVIVGVGGRGEAAEPCCADCGCHEPCQKVCRLVCEDKKVEVVCWGSKREDFCVAGPSKPGCRHRDTVCDSPDGTCDDDKDEVASKPRRFIWFEWRPKGCGKMLTKTKLMKKVETKTVPSYKWVVEDLCEECKAKQVTENDASASPTVALESDDAEKK